MRKRYHFTIASRALNGLEVTIALTPSGAVADAWFASSGNRLPSSMQARVAACEWDHDRLLDLLDDELDDDCWRRYSAAYQPRAFGRHV